MNRKWKKATQQMYPLHPLAMEHLQLDVDRAYAWANGKRYLPIPTNENSQKMAAEYQTWVQNGREC